MKGSIWESRFGPHKGEQVRVTRIVGNSVLVKSIRNNQRRTAHPESRFVKIDRLKQQMKRIK
jgi:hypothetical protein